MRDPLDLIDPSGADASTRIGDACAEVGFFRIPLDVIDRSIADAAWTEGTAFFDQPIPVRRAVEFPEAGYPYGWSPLRNETLAASTGDRDAAPDLKESYSVGPDCLVDGSRCATDSADERWIREPSRWPQAQPSLRPAWESYFRACSDVSAQLLSLMARALGLDGDHFEPLIDRHTSAMRALRYAAVADPGASLGAGAHTDYGTLTLLRTDEVAGLEVEIGDRWVAVPPDPETLVVNLGDSIAQWTNDRWRSTLHRVQPVDRQRQSFAFFHMANWDAIIECLPGCSSVDNPPRHEPVAAGPWLMSKFQSTVQPALRPESPD